MSNSFKLSSELTPSGDQPVAIAGLLDNFNAGHERQVLMGVTGSGKTFTVANIIQSLNVPTLVLAPNKTLASQLYGEFKELFPENAVEYFVSYYDYYQPEAYLPASDTYIEKDARINERIDRMRNSTTASLLHRRDVIVVASVSCIYGLGDPETYLGLALTIEVGASLNRHDLVRGLVRTQHARAESDFRPGSFRLRGSSVEIWQIQETDQILSVELMNDRVNCILVCDPLTGEIKAEIEAAVVFPVGHYVQSEDKLPLGLDGVRNELDLQLLKMRKAGKELEAERLERRVLADIEDIEESGHCHGIENYSRHFEGRESGQPPFTLLNYFPPDFLCVIDESHVALPQVYGMVRGDCARKQSLIDYGFRLPSALDNRPLDEIEFENLLGRALYLSATPGPRELKLADCSVVEQIVRPTGLLEPKCTVIPATGQVEDALARAQRAVTNKDRVLVTTLTKRGSEDLTEFFQESGIKAKYLHSDIDTIERAELLRDLRLGVFDVMIGINLLREGLDLPEVQLVLVLDADREGFLRSTTSLIQICGRAARHLRGEVVFYADRMTPSLSAAIEESNRRREIQRAYNLEHGVTPRQIRKKIVGPLGEEVAEGRDMHEEFTEQKQIRGRLELVRKEMLVAARDLDFETAIKLRDELRRLEALELEFIG